MDHTVSQMATHGASNYQPVPYQDIDGRNEDEYGQPGPDDSTSESDAHKSDNAHAHDAEMPRLKRHNLDWIVVLGDVAAVASPIALIVFASMVLRLDGSEAGETAFTRWNNATTVLGTLFPIIGRFVYEVARWKLEQGVTLGTLEQLLGSQTVGSTVLTHTKLWILNPLGIGLLFIWVFSPLGGQSLLRILGSHLEPVVEHSTIVHFDSDATSTLAGLRPASGSASGFIDDTIRYLGNWYSALLLAPPTIKTDGMDLWGNVRIPFLPKESGFQGWRNVSWSPEPEFFSSFAGYPVINVSMGNSTFSMQTSYLDLDCSKEQRFRWHSGYNITGRPGHVWDNVTYTNGTVYGVSRKDSDMQRSTTWNFGVDRFVDTYWLNSTLMFERFGWGNLPSSQFTTPLIFENETGIESKPAKLLFEAVITPGGGGGLDGYTVAAPCEMKQRYVESRVACSRIDATARRDCTVVAQRPSRRQHAPEDVTMLSFPSTLHWVSLGLPVAAGESSSGKADLSMLYLTDPMPESIIKFVELEDFERVNNTLFSRRLSQLFNTYLVLTQTDMATHSGLVNGIPSLPDNVTVPAQVSSLVQVYTISKPWMGVCFVSCIVLLCGGVFSVVFTHLADGPEILGYASTAVRDSRFLELLPEAGGMTAIDLTKMMRNERLRYGVTDMTRKGQRLLGVGREAETEQIKDKFD
ncbi:hypothetical protein ACHAPT_009574 [Fusarium lateritium]